MTDDTTPTRAGNGRIYVSTAAQIALRAVVATSLNGMTTQEIADALGVSYATAQRRASYTRAAGRIERVSGGPTARWCVAMNRKAAEAYVQALHLKNPGSRLSIAARRAKRERDGIELGFRAEFLTERRTIVPATACPPMKKLGPASVFELGAF